MVSRRISIIASAFELSPEADNFFASFLACLVKTTAQLTNQFPRYNLLMESPNLHELTHADARITFLLKMFMTPDGLLERLSGNSSVAKVLLKAEVRLYFPITAD